MDATYAAGFINEKQEFVPYYNSNFFCNPDFFAKNYRLRKL